MNSSVRQALATFGSVLMLVGGLICVVLLPVLWPVFMSMAAAGMLAAAALWPAVRLLGLPPQNFYYLALVCGALLAALAAEGYLLIWIFHGIGFDVTWQFTRADTAFRITAFLLGIATGTLAYRTLLQLPWVHALVLLFVHACILLVAGGFIAALVYLFLLTTSA